MSEYTATVAWARGEAAFTDGQYSRLHTWRFDGGLALPASASPLHVRLPLSDPAAVDPEEAFVAALASCHMLFFLSIAREQGFTVNEYRDDAAGIMEQNAAGKHWIARVSLRPRIVFQEPTLPTQKDISQMHQEAHERCYLANSVRTQIVVEEAM